jgi:hypothetical protein
MTRVLAVLVTLSVAVAVAMPMAAEAKTKRKKNSQTNAYRDQTYAPSRNVEKYEEFLADKRKIGTSSWWEQMDREGRGGQSRAN